MFTLISVEKKCKKIDFSQLYLYQIKVHTFKCEKLEDFSTLSNMEVICNTQILHTLRKCGECLGPHTLSKCGEFGSTPISVDIS